MICAPGSSPIFDRHMVGETLGGVEASPKNHRRVLRSMAEARRMAAKEMGDREFVEAMEESPMFSPEKKVIACTKVFRDEQPDFFTMAERAYKDSEGRLPHKAGLGRVGTNMYIRASDDLFQLFHIDPKKHETVLRHMDRLWRGAHRAKTEEGKRRRTAEYEWWAYQLNPANRGGAAIGDAMSAKLRMSVGLPLEGYKHRDWHALTLPLEEYVGKRMEGKLAR